MAEMAAPSRECAFLWQQDPGRFASASQAGQLLQGSPAAACRDHCPHLSARTSQRVGCVCVLGWTLSLQGPGCPCLCSPGTEWTKKGRHLNTVGLMALGGQAPVRGRILSRGPAKYSLGAVMRHRSIKMPLGLYVTPHLLGLATQGWSQPACQDLSLTTSCPKTPGPRNSWAGSAQFRDPNSGPYSLSAEATQQVTGLCQARFPHLHPQEGHWLLPMAPVPAQCGARSKSSCIIICQGMHFVFLSSARMAQAGKQGWRASSCMGQDQWCCEACVT